MAVHIRSVGVSASAGAANGPISTAKAIKRRNSLARKVMRRLSEGAGLALDVAQVERHQFAEPLIAERFAADALVHVGVGPAVRFDDRRSVLEDRHVPADDVAVGEGAVRALREGAS